MNCYRMFAELWEALAGGRVLDKAKDLRATCCNGQLYLCKIEKNRFSEDLSERRS